MIELLFLLVLFQVRHAIIIAYLHRDLCHKSVVYSPGFAQVTRILQWLGASGSFNLQYNVDWALTHKQHHVYSDTKEDPYWPIITEKKDPIQLSAPPMHKTKLDKFLEERPYGNDVLLLLSILFSSWQLVAFAMLVRWTPSLRMIWANYAYHKWTGWRWSNSKLRDNARNLYYGPLIFMGEELHSNHHRWPKRANFGVRWWEIDLSFYMLKLLSYFKLVQIKKMTTVNTKKLAVEWVPADK